MRHDAGMAKQLSKPKLAWQPLIWIGDRLTHIGVPGDEFDAQKWCPLDEWRQLSIADEIVADMHPRQRTDCVVPQRR
jgi:hypothetical protein